jgi:predicted aldo/keto reductase-like oxidoreductase
VKNTDQGRRSFLKAGVRATALGTAAAALPAFSEERMLLAEAQAMPTRPLGRTGLEVPIIHLGTSQRLDQKYDKVMHRCFTAGATWFDTALSYGWGSSHKAIANFLTQIDDRKSLMLTSKSGSSSVRGLTKGLDEALDELGTDYVDVFFMHGIDRERMLGPDFIATGERFRKSGKTRLFGFSCHDGNVVELMNKAARVGGIDVILFRYNFRRYGDRDLNLAIDACHKAGIGLLAMKTMGSVPADLEEVVRFKSRSFTLAQAKLKSVWADERIASICSEMDSVRVVRENITAAKTETPLTAGEAHQLNQLAALTAAFACNGCSHLCESAVKGDIAIAAPLRYLMYFESYGKRERARELYQAIPAVRRTVDASALGAACAACPQGIDIPARLARARTLLA